MKAEYEYITATQIFAIENNKQGYLLFIEKKVTFSVVSR